MFDGAAFGAEIVAAVKDYVGQVTAPLLAQIETLKAEVAALKGQAPVAAEKGDPGAPGPPGEKGEPGAPGAPASAEQISEAVRVYLEVNPPARGEKGEKGDAGDAGAPGRDGDNGQDGRDGCDATDAMIDRDGNLVIVFGDGRSKSLGRIVGRDGADGKKGAPGRDGLQLTDFDASLSDDGRVLLLSLQTEAVKVTHELQLPVMIYRGGFKDGQTYVEGDTVTFGGSLWCCNAETTEKPTEGRAAWRLAARKGRDGKDSRP